MAEVKPFCGLRFSPGAGKINELVCPPYDIISNDERTAFLSTNPHNVIRLELPREGENVYDKAGEVLNSWLSDGILIKDPEPGFYIYEEEFEINGTRRSFKGIIARVRLTDFDEGVVIPHENTLSAAKEDRFKLMCATNCNFSQIYCLFEDGDKKISNRISDAATNENAIYDFTDNENVTHRLWRTVNTAETEALFKEKHLFIADGHHRYETALRYRDLMRKNGADKDDASEYVMMMLVPMESEGLVVFPTHRIVHSLDSFSAEDLVLSCKEYFIVENAKSVGEIEDKLKDCYANGRTAFGLYCKNKYYLLILKDELKLSNILPGVDKTLRELDVTVLHSLVLEKLLGIDKENMAKQKNLTYTRSAKEAVQAVDSGADCAFILNPTRVSQIAEVGKAGQKMPQKSTYFYPKLITGLVMNIIK